MYISSWNGARSYKAVGDVAIMGKTIPPIAFVGAGIAFYFAWKALKKR